MFICKECICEHEYAFSYSSGACEMCGEIKTCLDVRNYCGRDDCVKPSSTIDKTSKG